MQGFDRGRGGSVLFKLEKGRPALMNWVAAAVEALEWSAGGGSGSVRRRMVEAARERFLDESVVAK